MIVLIFISESLYYHSLSKGLWRACSSPGFPGNQWANWHPGILHLPPEQRLLPWSACHLLPTVDCHPRTLLQTCEILYPLSHWGPCQWCWALSSSLRLGRYRACRPVGCSPAKLVKLLWELGKKIHVKPLSAMPGHSKYSTMVRLLYSMIPAKWSPTHASEPPSQVHWFNRPFFQ